MTIEIGLLGLVEVLANVHGEGKEEEGRALKTMRYQAEPGNKGRGLQSLGTRVWGAWRGLKKYFESDQLGQSKRAISDKLLTFKIALKSTLKIAMQIGLKSRRISCSRTVFADVESWLFSSEDLTL